MYSRIIKFELPKFILIGVLLILSTSSLIAQKGSFGQVIGGMDELQYVTNFLSENERGIRVSVLISAGVGGIMPGQQQGNRGGGGVTTMDIPTDTDYLELLLYYMSLDPRTIRKSKITLLRVKKVGNPPYMSSEIEREWDSYDFSKEYKNGGPFTLLTAGDVIIIQQRGLLNRPAFDFLGDVRTLTSLASLGVIFFGVYQSYSQILR